MKQILICLFALCISSLRAQQNLQGTVIGPANEPVPFAHIGIPGSTVGTASLEDGTFTLSIPEEHLQDQLTFSAIGYHSKNIAISELLASSELKVTLDEKSISLGQVTVRDSRAKPETMFKIQKGLFAGTHSLSESSGGTEIFTLVQDFEGSFDLSEVIYTVNKSTLTSFSLRCNIYEVDAHQKVGKRLLEKSLIIHSSIKKGRISFDLSNEGITVKSPFYVGLEWIISSEQIESMKTGKVNWQDYGVPEGERFVMEGGNRIMLKDESGKVYRKIKLTKAQSKQLMAQINSVKRLFLAMSNKTTSIYRYQSFAETRELNYGPMIEVKGYGL